MSCVFNSARSRIRLIWTAVEVTTDLEPNGASNDFRWKAVTFEGDGVHPQRLHRNHQIEIRALNVTMPERGPGWAFYCWWMDCRRPLSRRWHGAHVVHDVTPSENPGSSPKVINPSPREQPARDRVPRAIITLPSVSLDILSSTPHTSPVPTTRQFCGY